MNQESVFSLGDTDYAASGETSTRSDPGLLSTCLGKRGKRMRFFLHWVIHEVASESFSF